MVKFQKYGALVLWMVFSFPLIFQSLHYFEHHLDSCHQPDTDTHSHYTSTNESCAICDFEMALGDQPQNNTLTAVIVAFQLPLHIESNTFTPFQNRSGNALRAPPTMS